MIFLLVVLVFALIAAVSIIAALVSHPFERPHQHLDSRAADLDRYGDNLERLVAAYSDHLTKLAERKVDEMALLLNGARADRDRLLNALLATMNPQAAITLGRIEQAAARATGALTMRDFIEETRETETTDGEGHAIIPVGM